MASAALSVLATPLVIRLSGKLGLLDLPGLRKVHDRVTPRAGGVAIALAVLAVNGAMLLLHRYSQPLGPHQQQVAVLLAGSFLMFLLGFADDRFQLPAKVKLLGQLAIAALVCWAGIRLTIFGPAHPSLELLDWAATILWLTFLTNAVNLIDGLDGLSGGIAAAAAGVLAVFCLHQTLGPLANLTLALLGALLGFLFYNAHPARIFLGDGGTYFIGFLLAGSSCLATQQSANAIALPMLLLVLCVPILDVSFSILRRLLQRRSIFAADRNHVHHRLLAMGLPHGRAVWLLHALTLLGAVAAVLLMRSDAPLGATVITLTTVLLVSFFRMTGSIRLREASRALRQNLRLARQYKSDRHAFEDAQLRLAQVRDFDSRWRVFCEFAAQMHFRQLLLRLPTRQGVRTLRWRGPDSEGTYFLRMLLPIVGQTLATVRIEIFVPHSLELASRRVALLSRLLDESLHQIAGEWPALLEPELLVRWKTSVATPRRAA